MAALSVADGVVARHLFENAVADAIDSRVAYVKEVSGRPLQDDAAECSDVAMTVARVALTKAIEPSIQGIDDLGSCGLGRPGFRRVVVIVEKSFDADFGGLLAFVRGADPVGDRCGYAFGRQIGFAGNANAKTIVVRFVRARIGRETGFRGELRGKLYGRGKAKGERLKGRQRGDSSRRRNAARDDPTTDEFPGLGNLDHLHRTVGQNLGGVASGLFEEVGSDEG